MFYNIDLLKKEAEIGITVGVPEYWSHGYGTDALKADPPPLRSGFRRST
jgi:RimJ/RimL family protein N-acetyltransferase